MSIKIYNVLTRRKETFKPQVEKQILMYACGITVSGDAHIGHGYQAIVFGMIKKYFEYKGYNVKYVRNYTDVDDKIINKARELNVDPLEYAKRMMHKINVEMKLLNIDLPTVQCKATEHIDDMIDFINRLISKQYAYFTELGDVYFSVTKFQRYGFFSKNEIDENIAGTRKEIEPGKKDDRDFALWKRAKPGEIFWESPWGKGRPGWHIECSAMSMKYLGETLDIHGGGKDLMFPHHENEIAQSEALTGKRFSNYWIHNGLIKVNGQKMSKSLGNTILLEDLIKKYHPDVIYLTLLQNHYRSDINIIDGMFELSEEKIYKIYKLFKQIDEINQDIIKGQELEEFSKKIINDFEKAMENDFNSSIVISNLFSYITAMNNVFTKKNFNLLKYMKKEIVEKYSILGILQADPSSVVNAITDKKLIENSINKDEIEKLISKRAEYKLAKNYGKADEIREILLSNNIVINDTKEGTTWDINVR